MWAIAPLIAFFAALSDGVTWAVVPVFMSGFGPLSVLIVSFFTKKAYWKLEKFDYVCGLFSFLALVLWYLTKNPAVAIVFAILSDGLAAIPTITKSWKHPETEHASPFFATIISVSLSFFAIKNWSFSELAFSIYLILICLTFVFVINRKKLFRICSK